MCRSAHLGLEDKRALRGRLGAAILAQLERAHRVVEPDRDTHGARLSVAPLGWLEVALTPLLIGAPLVDVVLAIVIELERLRPASPRLLVPLTQLPAAAARVWLSPEPAGGSTSPHLWFPRCSTCCRFVSYLEILNVLGLVVLFCLRRGCAAQVEAEAASYAAALANR